MSDQEQQALKIVKNHMWWSMGAGLIPVPFVDLVAVTGVQMKMLASVSKVYGIDFQESRGKALVGSLVGYLVPSALSFGMVGSMLKAIPLVGAFVGAPTMALFCGGSAWALGKVFIQHFEAGGTLLTFDPEAVREHFKALYEEGRTLASTLETVPEPEPVPAAPVAAAVAAKRHGA